MMPPRSRSRGTRLAGRARIVARAVAGWTSARERPLSPARILVAHHLLLGDTVMLTPLLAKLRQRYPDADIAMTVPRAIAPLYATRPYGVRAVAWDPRRVPGDMFADDPFDIAFVPGDTRYSWLAKAMRARWIVAHEGDAPARKNWPVDELVPFPGTPGAWGDLVAMLVDGPEPLPYRSSHWPAPLHTPFAMPTGPYAMLHVGASSPLKQWQPDRWRMLAEWLARRGVAPVWSAGQGEEAIVAACDPERKFLSFGGCLDLAQLWQLMSGAALLVAPDTGIAHLARVVDVPTVALFGPGSAVLCGAGRFWRNARYRAVTIDPWPCRDQRILFRRDIAWVRRCGRSVSECARPACMDAIDTESVLASIIDLGVLKR